MASFSSPLFLPFLVFFFFLFFVFFLFSSFSFSFLPCLFPLPFIHHLAIFALCFFSSLLSITSCLLPITSAFFYFLYSTCLSSFIFYPSFLSVSCISEFSRFRISIPLCSSFLLPASFLFRYRFSILLRFSPAVWSTHPHASTPSWLALFHRVMTGDHEIPGISRGRSSEIRSGTRTVFLHGNEGLAAWKKARTRPAERDHTECRYFDGTPYENFLIDCLIVLSGNLSPVLLFFFFLPFQLSCCIFPKDESKKDTTEINQGKV